jgi:hypothetical protein
MIFGHTFGLITHPDQEWESIRQEDTSLVKLYMQHVLLLALIPAVSAYIGTTQVGWQIGTAEAVKLTSSSALQLCVLFYLAMICGVYILGKFIDLFAATYGVNTKNPKGVVLAAYTSTPLFIAGVMALYPSIWLGMFGGMFAIAYAVYLLYEGLPILMKIPPERGFMFASSVLTVGLVMLVALLAVTVVIWSIGIGPVYVRF